MGADQRSQWLYFFKEIVFFQADFVVKVKLSVGAVPLKREMLVKFALKVHGCCPAVYASVSG